MVRMARILASLLLLAACDPCAAAARVHLQRCMDGDDASCQWLDANNVDLLGQCHAQ